MVLRLSYAATTVILLALYCIAPRAQADLIVDIQGFPGSGQTTWTFGGSYSNTDENFIAGGLSAELFQSVDVNINGFIHSSTELSGEYASDANYDDTFAVFASSSATVTGASTGSHTIDGVFLDSDQSSGRDDFAWFATGTFNQLESLNFSGSAILNFDINTFGEGSQVVPFTVTSTSEITPLTLSFSEAAIPEPSTYTLFLVIVAGLFAVKRSRL